MESTEDFETRCRASLILDETLMVLIDQPLVDKSLQLVNAYLAARDIVGSDNSQLATFGIAAPADQHRLMLIVERATLNRHDEATQRHFAEFCTVIAVV